MVIGGKNPFHLLGGEALLIFRIMIVFASPFPSLGGGEHE